MKRAVSCLLIFLIVVGIIPSGIGTVHASEPAEANLLTNGSFEQTVTAAGWSGSLAPAGWSRFVFSGTPVFSVDTAVYHSGGKSARIEASAASRGTIFQQTNAVAAGKTYRISGWMKTENVSNQALVRYQIGRTSGGNVLVNIATASGTKDWLYFERTVTVPDNATTPAWLKVEAFLENSSGKVWFDDFEIRESIGLQGVSLNPPVLSLQPGETAELTPEFVPADATNRSVAWSSSDNVVASVNASGTVTAVSDGYAVITVKTAEGGYADSTAVSVGAPTTLSADPYEGTLTEDSEWAGQLSAHDSTGAPVTFEKAVDPKNGKLTVFPDGRFLYYPNPDFNGDEEFIYMAKTNGGGPKFAVASLHIEAVNDAPVLDLKWPFTTKNSALTARLQNGSDPENRPVAWSKVTDPAHGTLHVNPDGTYLYTPQTDYIGYDTFRVAEEDGEGGRTEGSLTVFVSPKPDDFIGQFRSSSAYGQHPRLLASKADFDRIRGLIGSDSYVTQWYDKLRQESEPLLETSPLPYAANGTNNGAIRDRLVRLGLMYQLSEDSRYADRTIQELMALSAYPDWGGRTNNILALAELTMMVSLAYDLVYEAMTPEQRTAVADAIRVKSLGVAQDWYDGEFTHNGEFNNINLVDNGNFGLAALAIADENPAAEAAAKAALEGMFRKLQQALRFYTPDGAWPEGPAYWHYGGQYLTYMTAAMNNVMGTDYGLSALPGFKESGEFPLHLLGEGGFFDFYDGGISMAQPESMWFASFFGKPELAWHLGDLYRRKGVYHPLYLALYKPGMFDVAPVELDKFYSAIESGSMRSAWDDPDALFASMKGVNETLKSHNDLDAGTFVFDALGVRWAMDSGNEDYSLPGYWDAKYQRWTYYRKKTEGHNTIVIDPVENPVIQQDPNGKAVRIREESKPRGAFSILDMTDVYKKDAVSMKRGMMLTGDRSELLVQDEMKLKTPSELYWFMHTKAKIQVVENGKAAILTQGDKRLYAELVEAPADAVFTEMTAEPLPTSPNPAQTPNIGVRKLAVHLTGVMEANLAIRLVPLYAADPLPASATAFTPLDAWTIPDGTPAPKPPRPLLSGLTVDGKTVANFFPKTTYYEVALPFEATAIPVVGASSSHSFTVVQAAEIPGSARATVQDPSNPTITTIYTVLFKRLPLIGKPPGLQQYPVIGVEASAVPEAAQGNTPDKTIDGSLTTRWSAPGKQWIRYDLGEVKPVSAVSVAIFNGNTRRAYFDIETSLDGQTWTTEFSGESSGTTLQPETLLLTGRPSRYVRLFGYGNSSNNYNSITEVAIYGPPPVSGIKLSTSELLLTDRDPESKLTANVLPAGANRQVSWNSADPNIASVSEDGTVTAVAEGRTTVTTTTAEGGFSASAAITVDLAGPVLTFIGPSRIGQMETVTASVYASDGGTGVASLNVTMDGSAKEASFTIAPLELEPGEHVVRAVATDHAGHETLQQFLFTVHVDAETLSGVLQAGFDRGWLRNEGILNSLLAKAEHAAAVQVDKAKLENALKAFEQEVAAQDGIAIDSAFARILLKDAAYIVSRNP